MFLSSDVLRYSTKEDDTFSQIILALCLGAANIVGTVLAYHKVESTVPPSRSADSARPQVALHHRERDNSLHADRAHRSELFRHSQAHDYHFSHCRLRDRLRLLLRPTLVLCLWLYVVTSWVYLSEVSPTKGVILANGVHWVLAMALPFPFTLKQNLNDEEDTTLYKVFLSACCGVMVLVPYLPEACIGIAVLHIRAEGNEEHVPAGHEISLRALRRPFRRLLQR